MTKEQKEVNFKKKFPFENECPCRETGTNGFNNHTLHKGKKFHLRLRTLHVMSCANHLANYVSGGFNVIGMGESHV